MTVGEDDNILQLCRTPVLGTMADSMSAAVVPGAKLLPITTYGPAKPRMLNPSLEPLMIVFCTASYKLLLRRVVLRSVRIIGLTIAGLRVGRLRGVLILGESSSKLDVAASFGFGVEEVDLCEA